MIIYKVFYWKSSLKLTKTFITIILTIKSMNSLENILEITYAIRNQKKDTEEKLHLIVNDALKKDPKQTDKSKFKEENGLLFSNKIIEDDKNAGSYLATVLKEYIIGLKEKMYEYYSSAKNSAEDILKDMTEKIKRTDKFIQEIEDWGVIYFKNSFRKLQRLTPMGMMARYQQKLWLYIGKNIK